MKHWEESRKSDAQHLEVHQKYSAARPVFNSLLGVSSGDETLRLMLDILRKRHSRKRSRKKMETFWFFQRRFRRADDSAYEFDFLFSQGHKRSYDSGYASDSNSVPSENQP